MQPWPWTGWPSPSLQVRAQIFRSLSLTNLNTIGYQSQHSNHLSDRLRISRPVYLLDYHSPLAVSRELSLTCSICLQNVAEIDASPNLLSREPYVSLFTSGTDQFQGPASRRSAILPRRFCTAVRITAQQQEHGTLQLQLCRYCLLPAVHHANGPQSAPAALRRSTFYSLSRLRQAWSTNRPTGQLPPARSTRQ